MERTLRIERPAFWTEPSDPESWFRALAALAARSPETGSPRAVAERAIAGVISRRGAMGLFGVCALEDALLPGVGLVTCDADSRWTVSEEANALLRHWQEAPTRGLALMAAYLVRESVWLRLLLLRLDRHDWSLVGWSEVRSRRGGIKAGRSLVMQRHAAPARWFAGIERQTAARWLARTSCTRLDYAPAVLRRKPGKDDLSLTPLTAPLILLESVGWLSRTGALSLPPAQHADLTGAATPAQTLAEITSAHADVRGFVAVEPVLRALLATFGVSPDAAAFARWMDGLIEGAIHRGALEILDAEPGQARHGRGLRADPTRKLVRWVVHPGFDDCFHDAWGTLDASGELTR